jgi:nitroreductase/NAD-dependent dihydropyrimidine dehydrogenase PreA subunit
MVSYFKKGEVFMKVLGVNEKTCIRCGSCIAECPARLFVQSRGNMVEYSDPHQWCNECGHCIAVCPEDAIRYEAHENALPLVGALPNAASVLQLLLSKRSIRGYKPDMVTKPEIAAVLAAMRCAPSGHNAQPCEYAVITDETVKNLLRKETIGALKKFRLAMRFHLLLKPFVPAPLYELMSSESTAAGIADIIGRFDAGEDPIFFNAPVIIAVHVPDMGGASFIDPSIAFTYGMIAAHSLNIGSCWMGFTILAVSKHRKTLDRLSVPRGRMIAGVMTLGYPISHYRRIPLRNEIKVSWFE